MRSGSGVSSLPPFRLKRILCRGLLSVLLTLPFSFAHHIIPHIHHHREVLVVIWTGLSNSFINRGKAHMLLGFFLEKRFGINVFAGSNEKLHHGSNIFQNKVSGRVIPLIYIERTDNSFKSVTRPE